MASFQLAYDKVLKPNEGGWVNSPIDRGGETYMGIARNFDKTWKGWPLIDQWKRANGTPRREQILPIPGLQQMVYDYFAAEYWTKNKINLITDQNCATLTLDMVVLHGRGKRIINRALLQGVAAKRNTIGNDTIKAINADPKGAYFKMLESRKKYFYEIVEEDPSQQGNMKGWLGKRYTPFLKPIWPFSATQTAAGAGTVGLVIAGFFLSGT